uniref:Uncharacterized protein n=1 Tax=Anopheles minimus TaxID=112268 RepID=A0A182WP18_9DIPT
MVYCLRGKYAYVSAHVNKPVQLEDDVLSIQHRSRSESHDHT